LRFEPRDVAAGAFHYEIGTAGATTLVLQTIIPALAQARETSRVELIGGTHVPASPSYHYLSRHWIGMAERTGLSARTRLIAAGFYPRGGGTVRCEIEPWRERRELVLENRGGLVGLLGVSAAARLKGEVARRQKGAAERLLWESRRLEVKWTDTDDEIQAVSPGSFIQIEAVFEHGRGAFCGLGARGLRAEVLGERVARDVIAFLDSEGAVDQYLADQLVVPLALGKGGRLTTTVVTRHLETVVRVLSSFGFRARTWSVPAEAGVVEISGP
jgi:RNA 3'-phosphate cyclase